MQATTKFQGSCTTYRDHTVLKWGDFQRTVPHDASNVATFNLAPGYSHFQSFCATAGLEGEDSLPQCYSIRVDQEPALRELAKEQQESALKTNDAEPKQLDFGFEGPEQAERFAQELEEDPPSKVEAEFLHYHQRFGHVLPKRIQEMARQGILPARLATCPIPVCTACLYGKATKKPWCSKPSAQEQASRKTITTPGAVVSVDMMTSPTPGLVAQMTGKPTHLRYRHAAVYVDQATGLGFVWLQKSIDAEETIIGKKAFENFCLTHGVHVKHYHADNGIFASNAWKESCETSNQGLSFTGVNAHHQNGVAE